MIFLRKILQPITRPFRLLAETSLGRKMLLVFSVIGPGIIAASVGNEAGGITTYSIAGATYGFKLLWTMIPITILLIIIQEMCSRMGIVTGKGLSDLIRESYGVKVTFFLLMALLFANLGTIMSEFAGIAASLEIFHVSRFIAVPFAAVLIWLLVILGSPKWVERIFIVASFIFLTYIISGFLAKPDFGQVLEGTFKPTFQLFDRTYIIILLGMIGTTATPWMQFYLQSAVVQKGLKQEEMKMSRLDIIVGCILANLVAYFIIVATGATLFPQGIHIVGASDAALALEPIAGRFAEILFGVGLLNASLFAGTVVPLATAYTICEGLGFELGIGKSWKEAGAFKGIFTALIVLGAIPILFPQVPLIKIMVYAQVVNGILLCPILVYIMRLVNKRWLMGEHKNGLLLNIISWLAIMALILLSLGFLLTTFHPQAF